MYGSRQAGSEENDVAVIALLTLADKRSNAFFDQHSSTIDIVGFKRCFILFLEMILYKIFVGDLFDDSIHIKLVMHRVFT